MRRRKGTVAAVVTLSLALAALACQDSTPPHAANAAFTAPAAPAAPSGDRSAHGVAHAQPGAIGRGQLVACANRPVQYGSALIGPSGGTLVVGNSRLIVPPGALLSPTQISGTIPDSNIALIQFSPTGLQFRKPAGLQLDTSGCDTLSGVLAAVDYLDDAGNVLEHIEAVYSNAWHTVAAPIRHFSGYAFAF